MVKPGYKETEVGVIPVDWEIHTLSEIGDFKNGINKNKEDFGFGVPFVNLMDVFGLSQLDSVHALGLVNANSSEQNMYCLLKGDVLFVRSSVKPSGVGLTTVVKKDLPKTVFSGFLLRYRSSLIHTNYKRYIFYADYFRTALINASTVSANTNISQQSLKQLYVIFPHDESEQQRIAEALSDMDELIASLEKLIAKKKAIKQGAMQELLTGKKRLPGFTGEWKMQKLKNVLTIKHGVSQRNVEDSNGKYPILATGGIIGWANECLYSKPSVLIGRKGTINRPQYMEKPFWSIDTLFYTAIHDKYHPKFVYYMFCRIDWMSYNEASGVPSLSAKVIENIEINMPEYGEQQTIASILSDMDAEISALEQKLAKCRQTKQGMMQQLLTGKIRLV